MALFQWNDSFSVGIPSIDSQHKVLVDYLNQLHDGMMSGAGSQALGSILTGLIKYTDEHFKHEEQLFKQYNYSEAASHTLEHQNLVKQVVDFNNKFQAGQATVSTDILNFLKDWLMNHILKVDKKYSAFLKEKGAK